jgi:hypothetical protein
MISQQSLFLDLLTCFQIIFEVSPKTVWSCGGFFGVAICLLWLVIYHRSAHTFGQSFRGVLVPSSSSADMNWSSWWLFKSHIQPEPSARLGTRLSATVPDDLNAHSRPIICGADVREDLSAKIKTILSSPGDGSSWRHSSHRAFKFNQFRSDETVEPVQIKLHRSISWRQIQPLWFVWLWWLSWSWRSCWSVGRSQSRLFWWSLHAKVEPSVLVNLKKHMLVTWQWDSRRIGLLFQPHDLEAEADQLHLWKKSGFAVSAIFVVGFLS